MPDETISIWKRVIGRVASAAGAVARWRDENWDDLLGLAGLVMLWHGIASFSVGAAWIIVGALVFAVAVASVLIPYFGRRPRGEG